MGWNPHATYFANDKDKTEYRIAQYGHGVALQKKEIVDPRCSWYREWKTLSASMYYEKIEKQLEEVLKQ